MSRLRFFTVFAVLVTGPVLAGDGVHGQLLYEQRCLGCHSLDANRVGPMHRGVLGRRAGSVSSYTYSLALQHATIVWDVKNLDSWLANPEQVLPGQRMNYRVSDAADRADLIAYLQRESAVNARNR
ncbi:MAG: c-type cytochrome [Rugosibacter sp.]|nr:c-type cytochrome [Rugosibacter sp.]